MGEALPPATEVRVLAAFATTATIDAKTAADLIGCDVSSLREMTLAGRIGYVIKGASTRAYREVDVRAFLGGPPASANDLAPALMNRGGQFNSRVVPFSSRPGKARDNAPKRKAKRG
jgi:hypothetical protein